MNFWLINAFFKLIKGRNCFKHLKRKYPVNTVKSLDKIINARCKIARELEYVNFYRACVSTSRFPRQFTKQLYRLCLPHTEANLRRIALSFAEKYEHQVRSMKAQLSAMSFWLKELKLVDKIRFTNFSHDVVTKTAVSTYENLRNSLISKPPDPKMLVHNISKRKLTRLQREALAYGSKFCVPRDPNVTETEAAFENLASQLSNLTPKDEESQRWCKVKLVDICHQYLNSAKVFKGPLSPAHLRALKDLSKDRTRVVLKLDKGSGVLVMDKSQYVQRMMDILNLPQFKIDNANDNTLKLEAQVRDELDILLKRGVIDDKLVKRLRPTGTQLARLYGLAKLHKPNIPLRPIVSMVNTPTHELSKWVAELLKPIRDELVKHSLKDSFEFVDKIQNLNVKNEWMCSLDVVSLFTNVPVCETIDYICQYINENHSNFRLKECDLRKLLEMCCLNVQFSFNDRLFRQTEGLGMGSVLAPILADIFMAKLENTNSATLSEAKMYFRYVDDTFIVCQNRAHAETVLAKVNSWHNNIKFTVEHESLGSIAFLDVKLSRRVDGFVDRRTFHKQTWSGQYLHFDSYCPMSRKKCLIKTLFNRALKIASPEFIQEEMTDIHQTLTRNGYPNEMILKQKQMVLNSLAQNDNCPILVPKKEVFITLLYRGEEVMKRVRQRLSSALAFTYFAAKLVVINRTHCLPLSNPKDCTSMLSTSCVIYKWECRCGASYLGRTERRLGCRIKEHVPRWLLNNKNGVATSSITKHILECGQVDNPRERFSIVHREKSRVLLPFLEAIAIKRLSPILCMQKESVRTLRLPWCYRSYVG